MAGAKSVRLVRRALGRVYGAKGLCVRYRQGVRGEGGGLETRRDDKTKNYYLADDHARYMRIIILNVCVGIILLLLLL